MAMRARTEDDKRALLFGGQQNTYRRPVGAPTNVATASEREMLEASNQDKVDGLRGRVGEMRHLALDIGGEVREQNMVIDGMGGTFDNAGDSVGRTIAEVKRLARSGGAGHMCVLFVFGFLFFLLVYLLLR